jgi:hypothetical protein
MIETIGHLNNAGMKPLFVLLCRFAENAFQELKILAPKLLPATRFHIKVIILTRFIDYLTRNCDENYAAITLTNYILW